jgi:two-component system response regulator VicR
MCNQVALNLDGNYQRQRHLRRELEPLGFELYSTPSLQTAREILKKCCCRLVIAHHDVAGQEIFKFCSFVRSCAPRAILIVLMSRIIINIEQRLFDCGADDVAVGKQTSITVLTRRIRAHLRNDKFRFGTNRAWLNGTLVDFDRREVLCNGSIRNLPGILNDLLKYFLENPNRIVTRDELLKSHIWQDSICTPADEGGKTFDVNVSKLRKIIEPDPTNPRIIRSVRGAGWKLAIDAAGV